MDCIWPKNRGSNSLRILLTLTSLIYFGVVDAKPNYQQARAFYDQLKKPFFDTGLFHKKPFQERVSYMASAKTMRDQAEKMFGVPSACFSAANARYDYVTNLHGFANRMEGRITSQLDWHGVTDPMYSAFTFGEHVAACYEDVEALDMKRR